MLSPAKALIGIYALIAPSEHLLGSIRLCHPLDVELCSPKIPLLTSTDTKSEMQLAELHAHASKGSPPKKNITKRIQSNPLE